jgi:hypothetical protein
MYDLRQKIDILILSLASRKLNTVDCQPLSETPGPSPVRLFSKRASITRFNLKVSEQVQSFGMFGQKKNPP